MINKFKNLKIVKALTTVSPKLKWLTFSQQSSTKKDSDYINMLCSDISAETSSDTARLEAMVRESLEKEFTSEVTKMKSYEFLVDSIVHNIKKNQLQAMDNQEEIA